MTHFLMLMSSLAFLSAVLCLLILPPATSSAIAVLGSMVMTVLFGILVLTTHRQDRGLPSARLSGRSTFSEGY